MKRVLIWDLVELKNAGGPSGYLYNIHEYLKNNPRYNNRICFLSDVISALRIENCVCAHNNISKDIISNNNNVKSSIKKLIPLKILTLWWSVKDFFLNPIKRAKYFHIDQFKMKNQIVPMEIINQFDYVHFHLLPHFTSFYYTYPSYKGKTILTSHCPCSWIDEHLIGESFFTKLFRFVGLQTEADVYDKVDYIMFPCREAREPYEKNFQLKNSFFKNNYKFFYVPSSIEPYGDILPSKIDLKKFNLQDNAIIIGYFGRHNKIKGYDILKKCGIELLNRIPNLYIISAGKGDIDAPCHDRWIELGFINNVKDWLEECDIYVLPNRETYFDLIVLEVLRSATIIITSNTGGNKYFKRFPTNEIEGIKYFDIANMDEIIKIVTQLVELKNNNVSRFKEVQEKNKALFMKYFTIKQYIVNYLTEIDKL